MAVPSKDALEALSKLTADPKNLVYIISGRDQEFLELHFGEFKNLGMSAEHGAFIKEPGEKTWTCFTDSLDMDWMGEALEIFKYYTEVIVLTQPWIDSLVFMISFSAPPEATLS